jgi:hypothetical protein
VFSWGFVGFSFTRRCRFYAFRLCALILLVLFFNKFGTVFLSTAFNIPYGIARYKNTIVIVETEQGTQIGGGSIKRKAEAISEVDPKNRASSEVMRLWWLRVGSDNPDPIKPSESQT